jgi:hypothetical protein
LQWLNPNSAVPQFLAVVFALVETKKNHASSDWDGPRHILPLHFTTMA